MNVLLPSDLVSEVTNVLVSTEMRPDLVEHLRVAFAAKPVPTSTSLPTPVQQAAPSDRVAQLEAALRMIVNGHGCPSALADHALNAAPAQPVGLDDAPPIGTPEGMRAYGKVYSKGYAAGLKKGKASGSSEQGKQPRSQGDAAKIRQQRLERDAARWRFTQLKGYFVYGPFGTDGEWSGYAVGIQSKGNTPGESILGRGNTLKKAIDRAILVKEK